MRRRAQRVLPAILIAVIAAAGCSTPPQSAEPTGAPSTTVSRLVGMQFPNVPLSTYEGSASVSAVDVVASRVVNLWATWCEVCRGEFALMAASQSAPFVIALNVDDASKSAAAREAGRELVDSVDGAFPVFIDSEDRVLAALGVKGLPVTVAVDHRGRIVDVHVGELTDAALVRLAKAATDS